MSHLMVSDEARLRVCEAYLVLFHPVFFPGFRVTLLVPRDVRVAKGQPQQVEHGSGASDPGTYVQRDQLYTNK